MIAGCAVITFAFYKEYTKLDERVNITPELATKDEDERNRNICLGFGITFGIITTLMLCIVMCFIRQVLTPTEPATHLSCVASTDPCGWCTPAVCC